MTYNSQAAARYGLIGQYSAAATRKWTVADAGTPTLVRVDPQLDMRWNQPGYADAPPGLPKEQQFVVWTGYLTLPASQAAGNYRLGVVSDDGTRLWVGAKSSYTDTNAELNNWSDHGASATPALSNVVPLEQGKPTPIRIEYYNQGGPGQISLYIQSDDQTALGALAQQLMPPSWLTPTVSALPAGWALSLPGGGGGYTRAVTSSTTTLVAGTPVSTPYSVVLTDGEGAAHTWYAKPALAGQPTSYSPPAGEDGTLAADTAGNLTLSDDDGSVYVFNNQGLPTSASSALDTLHPAAARYTYDPTVTPARVTSITDPVSGRAVTLHYGTDPACGTPEAGFDPAVAPNLLCDVEYWGGLSTVLRYQNGRLARVIDADGSTTPTITDFAYSGGLLTKLRAPLAADWVAADPTARAAAPVTTDIAYTYLNPAPAGSTAVRAPYSPATATNGTYPAGSIPVVTAVTAPSPDGGASTPRPQHTYTYVDPSGQPTTTQVHVAGLATVVDRAVVYDNDGRTLTDTDATGLTTTATYDAGGQDLPTSATDATGRKTTTIYDWAQRPTDTYGPAPAACFQASGFPVTSPPASCGVIPHTHTGYDTDTHGVRLNGLETSTWTNQTQSGPPTARLTTVPRSAGQPATVTAAGTSQRATGEISLPPGTYTFGATLADPAGDGVRVYVDDQPVLDRWETVRGAVAADTPTAHWRLSDPAGATTAANQVTAAGTGTPTGVTFGATGPGPVDPATGATFTGTSSRITLPTNTLTDTSTSTTGKNSTIELWFKTPQATTSNPPQPGVLFGLQAVTAGTTPNGNYTPALYIDNFGHLNGDFLPTGAPVTPIVSGPAVTDGKWHHAVLAATGTTETLYLDGTAQGTRRGGTGTTYGFIDATGQPNAQIGYGYTTSWPGLPGGWVGFNGQIADVATYQRALTADRAAAHYTAGTAKLTGTATRTFTTPPATAPGSLPTPPASTPHRIRVDYRNPAQTGSLSLTTTQVGGANPGVTNPIADTAFGPRYGLATWSQTDDAGGIGSGLEQTGTSYTGAGGQTIDPIYGLATATVVDPNGTTGNNGLALTRTTSYETPGATGYLRPTATALPSGDLTDPTKRTTTAYYGDQETLPSNAACGLAGVNQAGMARLITDPTPTTTSGPGTPVTTETAYDALGRVGATRVGSDGWTCLTYDARGRLTSKAIPAIGTNPARTVTTTYAVGGNPLVTSVADAAGTITTTADLLGRTVRYVDVNGTITTTAYDQPGRATTVTSTGAGGGTSTVTTGYDDAGKTTTVTLDGLQLATVAYSTNPDSAGEISTITYPAAAAASGNTPATGGNGMTLSGLTEDAAGRDTGSTFTLPGNTTITDSLTRSQAGRVTTSTATTGSGSSSTVTAGWNYTYDDAARLTQAVLAAGTGTNASRPSSTFGYGYSPTGGCGADPIAGKDSARTSATVKIGTGATQTTTTCTDNASRLTSNTVTNPTTNTVTPVAAAAATYDEHGNATRLGNQSWTYDVTDRVTTTTATLTAAQTGSTASSQKLTYTRDATDRVVKQVNSGTGPGIDTTTQLYGFIDGTDSPEYQLTTAKALGERYLTLPGGVLYTRRYTTTGGDTWSLPNLHGDITATTNGAGAITTSGTIYDPYGQPLDPATGVVKTAATPTTRTGPTTDAWEGSHQRGYQHTAGLNQTLMGARVYLPALGILTATDPVAGGSANDYAYPTDPINQSDLDGQFWRSWRKWVHRAASVAAIASMIPGPIGMIATGIAAAGFVATGDWRGAATSLVGFIPGMAATRMAGKLGGLARGAVSAQARMPGIGAGSRLFGARGGMLNSARYRVGWSRFPNIPGVQKGASVGFRVGLRGSHVHPVEYFSSRPW